MDAERMQEERNVHRETLPKSLTVKVIEIKTWPEALKSVRHVPTTWHHDH
jgi:hypothetical protein